MDALLSSAPEPYGRLGAEANKVAGHFSIGPCRKGEPSPAFQQIERDLCEVCMFEAAAAVISSAFKIGFPIYVAALIATSLSLFLPESVARQLCILDFRQSYREYLGETFVASISLLMAYGISASSRTLKNRFDDRRLRRMTLETLRMLTKDEKEFLRPFVLEGENTVHAQLADGVSGGLVGKSIVYRASNLLHGFRAPYNLQPIARKMLNEKPYLLD